MSWIWEEISIRKALFLPLLFSHTILGISLLLPYKPDWVPKPCLLSSVIWSILSTHQRSVGQLTNSSGLSGFLTVCFFRDVSHVKLTANVYNRVKIVTKVRLGFRYGLHGNDFFLLVLPRGLFSRPQLRPSVNVLQRFSPPSTPLIQSPRQPEWPSPRLILSQRLQDKAQTPWAHAALGKPISFTSAQHTSRTKVKWTRALWGAWGEVSRPTLTDPQMKHSCIYISIKFPKAQ